MRGKRVSCQHVSLLSTCANIGAGTRSAIRLLHPHHLARRHAPPRCSPSPRHSTSFPNPHPTHPTAISRTTPHTTTTRPSHSAPMPLHSQHHLESTSPGGGGGGGKGPVGWVVEVDGPSHSRERERDYQQHPWGRATGSTQLKRRHLQSLGLALVSIPYWEWNEQAAKGQQACQAYLQVPHETPIFPATIFFAAVPVCSKTLSPQLRPTRSLILSFPRTHMDTHHGVSCHPTDTQAKLALFQGQAGGGERLFPFPLFPESMPLPTHLELRVRDRVPSRSNL